MDTRRRSDNLLRRRLVELAETVGERTGGVDDTLLSRRKANDTPYQKESHAMN